MFRPLLPQGLRHVDCKPAAGVLSSPSSGRVRKHNVQPCPLRGAAHEAARAPAALFTPVASSSSSSSSSEQASSSTAPEQLRTSNPSPPSRPQSASRQPPGPDRPPPVTPADIHDEELYEEIRGCEAWQDVLDVVTDEGASMSTKRVVQALGRFSTLLKAARLPPLARAAATSRPEFQQLLALLYAKLSALKPSQACSAAMNLAALGVRPAPEHLAQLLQVLGQHAPQYNARDVATIMHALPSLGVPPASTAAQGIMDSLGLQASKLLHKQLAAMKPRKQNQPDASSTPPDAPSTSAAEPAAPSAEYVPRQIREAYSFTPQGVCMVLNAAAHLQIKNTLLLTRATDVMVVMIKSFTPQGVSNALWATATLDHHFPALLAASLDYFSQQRSAFKVQETSNIMWALCRLRHHPQKHAQALTQALLEQREGELKPEDLSSLLLLLSTFCVFPGKQLMGQLCRKLQGMLPQCSPAELCNCFRALGLLGETKRPVFAQIAALLPEHFERGELDDGLLRQVFQALLCATLADSPAPETPAPAAAAATTTPSPPTPSADPTPAPPSSVPSFPPLMMDSMKRLWLSTIQGGAYRANRNASPTKAVSDIIAQLHVRHDSARQTKDGLVLIDIALRPSQDRYVALQVLRGFDHSCNTDQLLGPAQLERQILEKNGWEVKYLLYQDLLQVKPDAQLFFIAEYLRNIGCKMQKEVAAPGAKGGPAAAAAATRAPKAHVSEAAREANILLRDPKASGPRTRKAT